jgi:hypothetical protein
MSYNNMKYKVVYRHEILLLIDCQLICIEILHIYSIHH